MVDKEELDYYYDMCLFDLNYSLDLDINYSDKFIFVSVYSGKNSDILFYNQYTSFKKNFSDKFIFLVINCNLNDSIEFKNINQFCIQSTINYICYPLVKLNCYKCSYGVVLNWIYRNIITEINPLYFAFIHHDLLFLDNVEKDLINKLNTYKIFGRKYRSNVNYSWWSVGSEFSCFYYPYIKIFDLDFMPCSEYGLCDYVILEELMVF